MRDEEAGRKRVKITTSCGTAYLFVPAAAPVPESRSADSHTL